MSSRSIGTKIVTRFLVATCTLVFAVTLTAQDAGVSEKERITAERFLQVLKRRPRPGTALDRVYGYYVQSGSLDEFIASLDVADDDPEAAQKQTILGLLQSQRGQQALAAKAFSKAESLASDDYASSYFLGRSLLAVGQTEKAAAAIERAIERQPAKNEALPIFTELGRIYGRAGQSEKALEVWKKLEALFPGDTRVGGQIAATLAEEGNIEEALRRFETLAKSARRDDEKVGFAVQAAEMQRRLGKTEECTAALEKILARLRPGSWLYSDVRNRIEDGFLKSGDYDALADYYKKKLAESEDDLALQVRLGRILVSARRLDEAAQTLSDAAKRAPDDPDVRLALVDVLVSKGEMAEAAKQFEVLADQDPSNPDYLLRWGQILLDDDKTPLDKRREAAAKVWQRLADARSDDAVTLSQIADRMRSIDRTDDAIALYEESISVDPRSSQYREYLGEYFYKLDRKEDAIRTWESIASDDRRGRDSLVRLAEVFGTFKETERALKAWREASELDLSFPQELRFAQKLRDAKMYDEAVSRLDQAEEIAETPDELEQLLKDRIATYQQAGTLSKQIAEMQKADATANNLRSLAMMHSAAGQLADAAESIQRAIQLEPKDTNVLLVSAEISERQDRFVDAVETFKKLATVDTRFQTNYLQRVADLQMRLGQVDEALKTCDALIDANPASAESYQFLARLAFRAGKDDQGITALRRAMNVAPRDNAPRRMLASAFADRYRTEEAIELYWQAMRYESKSDSQITLIKQLAPLYDRKGEIDELNRRIDAMGRDDVDARTVQLMISAAHESIENYGEARQAIDRLLADQPRDVSLLEAMVRLSDAADDVVMAAEFQERIVALADTPENRFRLVQLQLDAEIIDIKTALSERISLSSDPVRLGLMIRSSVRRGDLPTAIAICEETIRREPGLWDVKLMLAQLLLYQDGDDEEDDAGATSAGEADDADNGYEDLPKPHRRAIELANDLRSMEVPIDALPPTAQKRKTTSTQTTRPATYYTSPRRWSSSSYTLARAYRVGRYGSANYGYSSVTYSNTLPSSFGHARVLATAVEMIAIAKHYPGDEADQKIRDLIQRRVPMPHVDQITDANLIWEKHALQSISKQMTVSGSQRKVSDEEQKLAQQLNWRLAELDPTDGASYLNSMLMSRITTAATKKASAQTADEGDAEESESTLRPEQLDLVVKLYEMEMAKSKSPTATSSWSILASYRTILSDHFLRSGDSAKADVYKLEPPSQDASLKELVAAMSFYLRVGKDEQAQLLVDRLMPSVRNDKSGKSTTSSSVSGTAGNLVSAGSGGAKFVDDNRLQMIDVMIANAVKNSTSMRSRSSSLSDGTMNAYVRTSANSYSSARVKAPLSTELLGGQVVTELSSLLPPRATNVQPRQLNLTDEIIGHLDHPLEGAPVHEQKARSVLAAFAYWWTKRPQECYSRLSRLCEQYPDDVDLQIERARLASELSQPRVALESLDSFDPLDSRMLVRKEMAAMNLASQLGDVNRAKQAAERLFGLRMDTKTQLALADQLRRLGMPDKAAAVLRRLRGGRSRDERTELQIAQAFLSSGDKEAAAEVAYTVLQRIGSGRGTSSNASYYRQQAVSVLRTAKRLDPLIERAQRRVKSAPASTRARIELADLYTAAGRKGDAEELWTEIAKSKPNDPRQLIERAKSLYQAKKYTEAASMYLDAFEKDPQQFNRYSYEMTRCVDRGGDPDEMFRRLTKIRPESIPAYRVDDIIRVGSRSRANKAYTEAKRNFIAHALKNPDVKRDFYRYIKEVPEAEREKIPAIRKTIIDVISSDQVFTPTSSTWRVSSRSSGGTASGPLLDILSMLKRDKEAREAFLKAAEKASKDTQSAPTAAFLTSLLDTEDEEKRDEAIETIRSLFADESPSKAAGENGASSIVISGGLLWQGGQVIERMSWVDSKTSLLVSIYETAGRDSNVSLTDMRFSVGARLVKALQDDGQRARAREFLMDAYAKTDHSADDQYNPGYGDYQDIQSYQSIAEKLEEIGYPIDALLIHQRLIASPERFAKAKRWGGNLSVDVSQKAAEKVAKKVTPETSADYITQISQTTPSESTDLAVTLLELPLDVMIQSGTKPGIQMAIESASQSAEGQAALGLLIQSFGVQAEKRPDDWSIPATQLMVAIQIESDEIGALGESLMSRLPSAEKIKAAADTPDALSFRPLTNLYAVAAVALPSEDKAAVDLGKQLAKYLRGVSETIRDPGLDLAIAALGTGEGSSLDKFLDSIDKGTDDDILLTRRQTDVCLNIALVAAKRGEVTVVARALQLALGNGPPLRQLGGGGDAFLINQNQSNQPNQPDSGMAAMTGQLLRIIDLCSDATGVQLGNQEPNRSSENNVAEIDAATWKTFDGALQSIVMPGNQPGSAYPYAKRIASESNYDNYSSNDDLSPRSVSIAMARVAALAGTSDKLLEAIDKRLESALDKKTLAGVMVDVALASKDPDHLNHAIQRFHESVDKLLPSIESPDVKPEQTYSISTQMQSESYRKSDLIDIMVRTLAPVIAAEELEKSDRNSMVAELFTRTARFIESDSYTSNRHREILRRIKSKVLKAAATTGDQSSFESLLGSEVSSITQQFFGFDTEDKKRYNRNAHEALLGKLIADGMLPNSAKFLRKMIAEEAQPNYDGQLPVLICLEASKMSAGERYTFLKRLALGDDDKAPVLHWAGFVRYSAPPPMSARQVPRLQDVQSLSTCSPAVPVADTLLMLADLAAENGESESLAKLFSARSKTPGDPADIASALVRLASMKPDDKDVNWIAPTIQAVANQLSKTKPTKTDKTLVFPDLQLFLASRMLEKGMPVAIVRTALQDLRVHATRGQHNTMASMIGRAYARAGIGQAAGAKPQSPLEHFMVVSVPDRYMPDTRSLMPLYRADPDGWITGTGGQGHSLLMLRYPITGTFSVSMKTGSGNFAEADLSYGGVNYPPVGWTQKAKLVSLGRNGVSEFAVPSIKRAESNKEELRVSPDSTIAVCNDQPYATDIFSTSFPFVAVSHIAHRTIRVRDLEIQGDATIPSEVSLIDPTMRGWASYTNSVGFPDPLLPLSEENINAEKIRSARKDRLKEIGNGSLQNAWYVKDDVLTFQSEMNRNQFDPGSHLQYLRPLQDGETVELSFWWDEGDTELYPSIGRSVVQIGKEGALVTWKNMSKDSSAVGYVSADKLDPPADRLAKDNLPKEESWNKVTMSRDGDRITMLLNDKPLAIVPVAESTRPGFMRVGKTNAKIRTIKLSGDWPSELPSDLMQINE